MTAPFQQSPQERWQIIAHPAALPGSCFLCGGTSESREWFVDTTLQFEFWGAVYICKDCLFEMARTAGWSTPEQTTAAQSEIENLVTENYRLMTEVAGYHQMEEAINAVVESRGRRSVLHRSGHPSQLELLQGEGTAGEADVGDDRRSPGTEGELGAGEGTSPEPNDGEGVDKLRSTPGSPGSFTLGL